MRITTASLMLAIISLCHSAFCGEIHDAVKAGDVAKVKVLLTANPNLVNARNDVKVEFSCEDVTPLFWAANKDVAEMLLKHGAIVNTTNECGKTPLHLAALKDHKDVAELLLSHGANVNAFDNNGGTPLGCATKKVAELLLTYGAIVNTNWSNDYCFFYTPLSEATIFGHKDVVELLLAHGADRNPKDKDFALIKAASYGHKDVAELLLAHGANANAANCEGDTPLHFAAGAGCKAVAELLLAHKAGINTGNYDGKTPLHLAAQAGQKDVAESLLIHGADVSAKTHVNTNMDGFSTGDREPHLGGWTPLHWATWDMYISQGLSIGAVRTGQLDVAELLLAHKADVNAKADDGRTPLHLAVEAGHKNMVEWLLAHKADVNAKTDSGQTPFELAINAWQKNQEIVELLRPHGGK